MTEIAKKLKELGIVLPEVSLPAANYVPVVVAGGMAFVSGQLPMQGGKPQF
ncbi:MAG: RidA family protein, partial [Alphaproteobacteria bacterium]